MASCLDHTEPLPVNPCCDFEDYSTKDQGLIVQGPMLREHVMCHVPGYVVIAYFNVVVDVCQMWH